MEIVLKGVSAKQREEQRASGVDRKGNKIKTAEEIAHSGWPPHYLGEDAEDSVWAIIDLPTCTVVEARHRKLMNDRLAAKPLERLRSCTQLEHLEAERESVLLMRECGGTFASIANTCNVRVLAVRKFFAAEDTKETV